MNISISTLPKLSNFEVDMVGKETVATQISKAQKRPNSSAPPSGKCNAFQVLITVVP